MRLVIIIRAYRVVRDLGRCLNSLIDQDLSPDDHEIIVVDDRSPDRSYEVAARDATRHPHIRVHRQSDRGLGPHGMHAWRWRGAT